jgi:hypothetical protein
MSVLKMVPLTKRRILGDKSKLPMELASGNTVLIIEDKRDVVHLLTSTCADQFSRGHRGSEVRQ